MLTKEDLKLLSEMMDSKLEPINKRLDKMDERLDKIEYNTEVTREVVNSIVEWIDVYFRKDYPFPVDKKEAI